MSEQTETLKEFYSALSKAQGAISGATKNNTNPHFKSKYADLEAAWDACRDQLSKNGLAILQFPDYDPETQTVRVETVITHSSGIDKTFCTRIPVTKQDAQGAGSAITYARRYALMAAIGIAPEDDDGNAASQPTGKGTGYRSNGKPTAGRAKNGGQGSWQAFKTKLESFTDPDECAKWFNAPGTQALIQSWPKSDAGDWHEIAADEYDKHIQTLYGTKAAAE